MKRKRRRSRNRSSQPHLPLAARTIGFTDDEEAFFAVGARLHEPVSRESFDDLDVGYQRPASWLRRLFARA